MKVTIKENIFKIQKQLTAVKMDAETLIKEQLFWHQQLKYFIQDLFFCLQQIHQQNHVQQSSNQLILQYEKKIDHIQTEIRQMYSKHTEILEEKSCSDKQLRLKRLQINDLNHKLKNFQLECYQKNQQIIDLKHQNQRINNELNLLSKNYQQLQRRIDIILQKNQKKPSNSKYQQHRRVFSTLIKSNSQSSTSQHQSHQEKLKNINSQLQFLDVINQKSQQQLITENRKLQQQPSKQQTLTPQNFYDQSDKNQKKFQMSFCIHKKNNDTQKSPLSIKNNLNQFFKKYSEKNFQKKQIIHNILFRNKQSLQGFKQNLTEKKQNKQQIKPDKKMTIVAKHTIKAYSNKINKTYQIQEAHHQ